MTIRVFPRIKDSTITRSITHRGLSHTTSVVTAVWVLGLIAYSIIRFTLIANFNWQFAKFGSDAGDRFSLNFDIAVVFVMAVALPGVLALTLNIIDLTQNRHAPRRHTTIRWFSIVATVCVPAIMIIVQFKLWTIWT